MPGIAYGTAAPAVNACDCTPTPRSLVAGSNAMIEKVANQRAGFEGSSTPASGACAAAFAASATVSIDTYTNRFMGPPALRRRSWPLDLRLSTGGERPRIGGTGADHVSTFGGNRRDGRVRVSGDAGRAVGIDELGREV